ncbi:hypothetical protein F7230_08790 [Corynebacterium sp. 320]|uniref:hypothetical protein n=1 Tax=Corynebacterium TaxID=1716 RepID=UPI00125CD02B|nr:MULTISPECIES: hypothetical protein [Corynebacterium]KAB1502516.1 hypothetical protein F7230_08790 [Corynebacterium sp. 320]KAB1551263.1 hypothetical protein F7233_06990 [Corynebacterium sp. 321]KAB1551909.1 hypothetical protein F7232_07280 [Corynebacterium sp. 319]KAB3526123.1 hypothetical protein F8354_08790 [Corynebacterium sp. 250]KAB3538903.1 hypothetical protein F8390_07860 [Corynebacterium sp. 366]
MPDYSRRAPTVIAKNKKRVRQLEWEDTRRPAWVAWVGGLCLVALIVGLVILSTSDRVSKAQLINGDQLGPIDYQGQDYADYARRELDSMEGTDARWALVSTQDAWNAQQLADVLGDFPGRVSTLYFAPGAQWVIPEPVPGHTRKDVLMQAVTLWGSRAQVQPEDITITSVLVYGAPERLKELGERAVVEPAPVGAAYGRIGIRPMNS